MKFLNKTVSFIFLFIMVWILILLFLFSNIIDYPTKAVHIVNNLFLLIPILVIFLLCSRIKILKKDICNKRFYIILILITVVSYLFQLIIQKYAYFHTGWDAGLVRDTVDEFTQKGILNNLIYFTRYQNNIFITFILSIIRHFPFFGKRYAFTLAINSLLVNLSCLMCVLTYRNLTRNNIKSIIIYIVLIPLIMLSPWINIVYSDTFSILFPILILYIYTLNKRKLIHYFLIPFLAVIGYFFKPTVIIILIAILIVEIFNIKNVIIEFKKKTIKQISFIVVAIVLGLTIPFGINSYSKKYLKFEPLENVGEFNFLHFLAMGQNDDTKGIYNDDDVTESINNGMSPNWNKFLNRLKARNFKEQLYFFGAKTLVNFNDGTFAWGFEGSFYKYIPEDNSKLTKTMRNIYYNNGKYYSIFSQFCQFIWILVLCCCPFIVSKKYNKNYIVIMLAIIGITMFLTLFEARARYLYCYSPIFIVCFALGFDKIVLYSEKILIAVKKKYEMIRKKSRTHQING